MKKSYFLSALLLFTSPLFCQYTITYNNNCPQAGDAIPQLYFNEQVNPGPSGANQSWDFANVGYYEEGLYMAVDPSGTPYGDSFPEANIAYTYSNEEIYHYGLNSPTESLNLGMGFDANYTVIVHYSDPATLMVFPFSYSHSFTDNYYGEYTVSGLTTRQRGSIEAVADGWGTLATPAETYTDVLRVKTDRVVIDSIWMGDTYITRNTYSYTDYSWFTAGIRIPVLCIVISESNNVYDTVGYYVTISEQVAETENSKGTFQLYPNPANDYVHISFLPEKAEESILSIIDMQGRELIRRQLYTNGKGDIETYRVSLRGLTKGMYLVKSSQNLKPARLIVR